MQYCDSALFSLDTSTGEASLIGLTGTDGLHGGGLAYNSDNNTLYATGSYQGNKSALYTINASTGLATLVGQTIDGLGLSFGGLEYDPISGLLSATGWNGTGGGDPAQFDSMLFEIDPLTGNAAVVGSTGTGDGLSHGGLAIAPAVVPIPPALYLFGSGLIGLLGISRRKKNASAKA